MKDDDDDDDLMRWYWPPLVELKFVQDLMML